VEELKRNGWTTQKNLLGFAGSIKKITYLVNVWDKCALTGSIHVNAAVPVAGTLTG